MKILTLWQPWASLIAFNLKRYETRSWGTTYRGKLAIHAAKRPIDRDEILPILYATGGGGCSRDELDRLEQVLGQDLPLGKIVAIANLADCRQMVPNFNPPRSSAVYRETKISIFDQSALESAVGLWESGRFAWKLDGPIALPEPIPLKGAQGLKDLTDTAALQAIAQQTEVANAPQ